MAVTERGLPSREVESCQVSKQPAVQQTSGVTVMVSPPLLLVVTPTVSSLFK